MVRTQRNYDTNGWLLVENNPIAKTGVFPYLGSEIGAPEPDKIYNVLVHPDEFGKPDFLQSLSLVPIIDEHELIGELGISTDERPIAGVTGTAQYKHPYIYSDIKVYSDAVQKLIDNGKVGLSTAYTCEWIEENGTYNGQPYEYRQIVKTGNHLALVDKGRFGKDIAVLNSNDYVFNSGGFLPMTIEELLAAIANLSDEDKAALIAALVPSQNESDKPVENEAEEAEAEAAEAAESTEEAAEAAEEAQEAVKDGTQAEAEESVAKAVEAAEKALDDVEALEAKVTDAAMNAAIKHIDARNAMAAKVKPFIGVVPATAMNSAESIAEYACKKLGVPHGGGEAAIVLNAYLHNRKPASEQAKAALNSKPVDADSIKSKIWGAK